MSKLKPTHELQHILNQAKEKPALDAYLNDLDDAADREHAFADYYFSLPAVQALSTSTLIERSNLNKNTFDNIKSKERQAGRDKILALCAAVKLPLNEVNRCLELGQAATLYPRNHRDAVIIYAINHQLSLIETNELLDSFGETLI